MTRRQDDPEVARGIRVVGKSGRSQQERTEETKASLLAAAERLLGEVGYAQVSVAKIVRDAGRAHGTFYLYFDNKEEIYEALLEDIWDDLRDQSRAVWRDDSPYASVHETVRRYVLSYQDHAGLWQLLGDMSATNPKFRDIRDERRRVFVRRIDRGIRGSVDSESLAPLRSEMVAELLAGMVDDICATAFLRGRDLQVFDVVDHIAIMWSRVLGYAVPGVVEAVHPLTNA